jgi:hypothetical protein
LLFIGHKLLFTKANASELELLASSSYPAVELKELYIDYKNYSWVSDYSRNMLIYPESPKEAVNLGVEMDLFRVFYWNSEIQSLTTSSKYESVGLDTRLGLRLFESLEVGWFHKSQHVLDRKHSYMPKYPSEDAIQIKIFIYSDKNRRSLF